MDLVVALGADGVALTPRLRRCLLWNEKFVALLVPVKPASPWHR